MEKAQTITNVQPGDRIRFKDWGLYKGEKTPRIQSNEYTGEVLEVWGICRTFLRVKRERDARKVIMFLEDVAEILQRKSEIPANKFAAAASGKISATADTRKGKAGAGSKKGSSRSG